MAHPDGLKVVEYKGDGKLWHSFVLVDGKGQKLIQHQPNQERIHRRFWDVIVGTFLPNDYPRSVKPEYLEYQLWDALQGLCSYLRSVITTRSLLIGAGVGEATSTPLSAAISWVLKDGFGMIGSLIVAYVYADSFEVYTKEWRLVADFLNNLALILDLVSSTVPSLYFVVLVCSSICKSCCGLIAGATKSRISAHFAAPGYLADVSAKESTQETAVALVGLVLGAFLAKIIGDNERHIWAFFFGLLLLHSYSNYRLIKVLVFDFINTQRAWLIVATYLKSEGHCTAEEITLKAIARKESLWRPFLLSWQGPRIGVSLESVLRAGAEVQFPQNGEKGYVLALSRKDMRVDVALRKGIHSEAILHAVFCACIAQQRLSVPEIADRNFTDIVTKSAHDSKKLIAMVKTAGWNINEVGGLAVKQWRFEIDLIVAKKME